MPGEVQAAGFFAKLADTIIHLVVDEDKLPEILKRRALAAKKKEVRNALANHDWVELRRLTDELERLSNSP